MLHALLPAHKLDHLTERLPCLLTPQQEAAASLQEHREVLNVRPGEVVQADLEHVQDDVRWDNAELGEVRQESDVTHADFRQLLHNVLFPLEVPELIVQLSTWLDRGARRREAVPYRSYNIGSDIRHVPVQDSDESGVVRQQVRAVLGDLCHEFHEPLPRSLGVEECKVDRRLIDDCPIGRVREASKKSSEQL